MERGGVTSHGGLQAAVGVPNGDEVVCCNEAVNDIVASRFQRARDDSSRPFRKYPHDGIAVMPANAGILGALWTPAFAGVTSNERRMS